MMAQRETSQPTPTPLPPRERELRCWRCNRLLARIVLLPGCRIETKCRDCRAINVAEVDKDDTRA